MNQLELELMELSKVWEYFVPNNNSETKVEYPYHCNYWVKTEFKRFLLINPGGNNSKLIKEIVERIEERKTRHTFILIENGKEYKNWVKTLYSTAEKNNIRQGILQGIWDGSLLKLKDR